MNEIQIFNNPEFGSIRVLDINGEPWMVLKDVCLVLGITHVTDTANRLEEDEVGQTEVIDRMGRTQTATIINEPGFYSVILRSDKPKAKPFRKWVTSEVLPSIRKHGAYMTPDVLEKTMQDPDFMIGILNALKDEQARRKELEVIVTTQTNTIQEQQTDINRMRPKEIFADSVAASDDTILIRDLAKLLKQNGVKTGEKRLYAWMRDNGYIMRFSTQPTQRAMNLGLFVIKESTRILPTGQVKIDPVTRVTGKGQQYFINKGKTLKVMDGER